MPSRKASQFTIHTDYRRWKDNWLSNFPPAPEMSSLISSIVEYLETLKVKTVVEQRHYSDLDYSAAFARFYSNMFNPPPKNCTRFIFFSELLSNIEDIYKKNIGDSLIGFITMWPTDPPIIGRTLLPLPSYSNYHTGTRYKIHLAGKEIESKPAVMFASKDFGASVCATISTWLATELMHEKFDLDTCTSVEITLHATAGDPKWGRPLPQVYGLSGEQIVRALWNLNYEPFPYYFSVGSGAALQTDKDGETDTNWIGPLYGYIRSGIPVIILVEASLPRAEVQHAILAVGVEIAKDAPVPETENSLGRSFTNLVAGVIVHDDHWGPYSKLKPHLDGNNKVDIFADYEIYGEKTPLVPEKMRILSLIVPLPQSVVLTSRFAHALGTKHLTNAIQQHFRRLDNHTHDVYKGPYNTYLERSNEIKSGSTKWGELFQGVSETVRSIAMPRWVWVTEAFLPGKSPLRGDKPFARAFCDSTQLQYAKQHLVIVSHVEDEVTYLNPWDGHGVSSSPEILSS
jgi:hypothetical protein